MVEHHVPADLSRAPVRRGFGVVVALFLLVFAPRAAPAQEAGWNDARVRALVERAVDRRASVAPDSGLRGYTAQARGHVYFYLDRREAEERTLVKVDQVALELYWQAPDKTKQRIVGLRDESRLPNRMYYHLDHLTVVQNNFDDVIRMGHGDEVRDVPHPVAAGADSIYDYRLADSLELRLPSSPDPIRVHEIEVRPRSTDRAAIVGTVYIDAATAKIARMTFTFTPASYIDPRLDYIRVSLDNGLWEGRYWLPGEQRVEIRRQVPELDFPVGGVIRANFRIHDYRLNPSMPDAFFEGPPVVALPKSIRERYSFETDIFADLDEEGLAPPPDFEDLRARAAELARGSSLSGLPKLRLHLPDASSALRYNRAEGLFAGAGVAYGRLEATAGYALGARHATLSAGARVDAGERTELRLDLYRNALRDPGIRRPAAGVMNTLFSAVAAEDYLDPYFASGLRLRMRRRLAGPWRASAALAVERHRSADLADSVSLFNAAARFDRPVRPIDEGRQFVARGSLSRPTRDGRRSDWSADLSLEAGLGAASPYARSLLSLGALRTTRDRRTEIEIGGTLGLGLGTVPRQRLFPIGGRATLPGQPYRAFVGDRLALVRATASHTLVDPWVRLRLIGAVGWLDASRRAARTIAPWDARPTDGVRGSLGLGFGLVHDILRIDAVRGLGGGDWELILSVDPDLWDLL